jgi:hypothetical protein
MGVVFVRFSKWRDLNQRKILLPLVGFRDESFGCTPWRVDEFSTTFRVPRKRVSGDRTMVTMARFSPRYPVLAEPAALR